MTREEAKEILNALWLYKDCGYSDNDVRVALDIAIKVLEQEPTLQDKQAESEKYQKAYDDGYDDGYAQARFDYDALGKIRADIKELATYDNVDTLVDVIRIIDKYAGGEGSNG